MKIREQLAMSLEMGKSEDISIDNSRAVRKNGNANKLDIQDRAFHNWYRFVLSYPPHLVRDYLDKFSLTDKSIVLDPFCGTGTTLVEAKLRRVGTIGIEAHPFLQFAASVKLKRNTKKRRFFAFGLLFLLFLTPSFPSDMPRSVPSRDG